MYSYTRITETIFLEGAREQPVVSAYFLLVLIGNLQEKPPHEWQDGIEQHCKEAGTVTTIVLETGTFMSWLKQGQRFAHIVTRSAAVVYDAGTISPPEQESNYVCDNKILQRQFTEGLNKTEEFMTGAILYRIRKQNKMAAFMLHQAAEQALHTVMKVGTGYHTHTHNLERLLRYGSMVAAQLQDVFPQHTDRERQLFRLLQRAYSDTRYKDDYKIEGRELGALCERVEQIKGILEVTGKAYINTNSYERKEEY